MRSVTSSPASSRHGARRKRVLEQRAHAMQVHATFAEQKLWTVLSGNKLGVAFRRQVPLLGQYIADFAALSVKIVVEVDGGYHAERRSADASRDERLRRAGWRVLRLPEGLVHKELDAAVARVVAAIRSYRE